MLPIHHWLTEWMPGQLIHYKCACAFWLINKCADDINNRVELLIIEVCVLHLLSSLVQLGSCCFRGNNSSVSRRCYWLTGRRCPTWATFHCTDSSSRLIILGITSADPVALVVCLFACKQDVAQTLWTDRLKCAGFRFSDETLWEGSDEDPQTWAPAIKFFFYYVQRRNALLKLHPY